jgi:hypothetical protein
MIIQFGLEAFIKTLCVLVSVDSENKTLSTLDNLRRAYRHMIRTRLDRAVSIDASSTNYVADVQAAKSLRDFFVKDSLLDDKAQGSVIKEEADPQALEKVEKLKAAHKKMYTIAPTHGCMLDLIITDIFLMPSERGQSGSTSGAIGVIWANPKLDYAMEDIIELLVHEMTHNLMFLDEMRYLHYKNNMLVDKRTWAQSAILKSVRPLDKVFHSLVVALEILMLREKVLGHPKSPKMHPPSSMLLKQVRESFQSIKHMLQSSDLDVFHPRGFDILNRAETLTEEMIHSSLELEAPKTLSARVGFH